MSNDEAPTTSFVYTDRRNPKVKMKREASFSICNHEKLDIQNSILLQPGMCGPTSQSHLFTCTHSKSKDPSEKEQ